MPSPREKEVYILGAGIAGLSSASILSRLGFKVSLFEQENTFAYYSSGRNAGIGRSFEAHPYLSFYLKKSLYKASLLSLLKPIGLYIKPLEMDYYERDFLRSFPFSSSVILGREGTFSWKNFSFSGYFLPGNGILDIHSINQLFYSLSRRRGVSFFFSWKLVDIEEKRNRIAKLIFYTPEGTKEIPTYEGIVINAKGSWAGKFFPHIRIYPHKRHLFYVEGKERPSSFPILWSEREDVYLKPEGAGFLLSYCDEEKTSWEDYEVDHLAREKYVERILPLFPFLEEYRILRIWACLRSFSLDKIPVIGWDSQYENLFWVAGLGGKGMSLAFSIGELVKKRILRKPSHETEIENPLTSFRLA